jgi:hypothetical protein
MAHARLLFIRSSNFGSLAAASLDVKPGATLMSAEPLGFGAEGAPSRALSSKQHA